MCCWSIKFVVSEEIEEKVKLGENEKFCCNLATILAKDTEVVAVEMRIYSVKCIVNIFLRTVIGKKDVQILKS